MGKDGAGGSGGGDCCGERTRTHTVQDPALLKKVHDLETEVIVETGLREAAQKRVKELEAEVILLTKKWQEAELVIRKLGIEKEIDDMLFWKVVDRNKKLEKIATAANEVIHIDLFVEPTPKEREVLTELAVALSEGYRK